MSADTNGVGAHGPNEALQTYNTTNAKSRPLTQPDITAGVSQLLTYREQGQDLADTPHDTGLVASVSAPEDM